MGVAHLPNRCLCQGDGATWADTSACPVHSTETSPLAQAVQQTYEEGSIASRIAWLETQAKAGEALKDSLVTALRTTHGDRLMDLAWAAVEEYQAVVYGEPIAESRTSDEESD